MNNEINNNTKLSDEQKQNVLNNFEANEQDNTYKTKDDSNKAALLAILIIIIIIVGVVLAFKFGFNKRTDSNDKILNDVANNASDYNKVIINYLNKYDYNTKNNNSEKYLIKDRYYDFIKIPEQNRCLLLENSIEDGVSNSMDCSNFMKDIENNYCRIANCSIPGKYDIRFEYSENNFKILDGTILIYDDVECTLKNQKYICEYKK